MISDIDIYSASVLIGQYGMAETKARGVTTSLQAMAVD